MCVIVTSVGAVLVNSQDYTPESPRKPIRRMGERARRRGRSVECDRESTTQRRLASPGFEVVGDEILTGVADGIFAYTRNDRPSANDSR
jgi:hypothetical protein